MSDIKRKKGKKIAKDKVASWLFIMPTLIFLAITALFPLLYSVYLSFFRLKLNLPKAVPQFIFLGNYIRMFTDKMLLTSTVNTIVFAVFSVNRTGSCYGALFR